MVEQQLSMTVMTLVAAIGGNLSLYLGASFLALIHIVVFIVKLPFEHAVAAVSVASLPKEDSTGGISSLEARMKDGMENLRRELMQFVELRCSKFAYHNTRSALVQISHL